MLDYCQALTWTMGDDATIDAYCGLDPSINITHDKSNVSIHFPGCGLFSD